MKRPLGGGRQAFSGCQCGSRPARRQRQRPALQAHADSIRWQERTLAFVGSAIVTVGLLLGEPAPVEARARLGSDEQKQVDMFLKNTASVVNVTSLSSRRDAFTSDMQDYPQGAGSGIVWDSLGHVVVRRFVLPLRLPHTAPLPLHGRDACQVASNK